MAPLLNQNQVGRAQAAICGGFRGLVQKIFYMLQQSLLFVWYHLCLATGDFSVHMFNLQVFQAM